MDIISNDLVAYILSFCETNCIGKALTINKLWKHIIENYSFLFHLDFSRNEKINDTIFKYFKNIKFLEIKNCIQIKNISLQNLSNIEYLNLSKNEQITDEGLKYFKISKENQIHCLKSLDLSFCKNITDNGLQFVDSIKNINLMNCNQITDNGIKLLTNIENINLVDCSKITDESLKYLEKAKKVYICGCKFITNDGIKYLKMVENIFLPRQICLDNVLLNLNLIKKIYVYSLRQMSSIKTNKEIYIYYCVDLTSSKIKNINKVNYINYKKGFEIIFSYDQLKIIEKTCFDLNLKRETEFIKNKLESFGFIKPIIEKSITKFEYYAHLLKNKKIVLRGSNKIEFIAYIVYTIIINYKPPSIDENGQFIEYDEESEETDDVIANIFNVDKVHLKDWIFHGFKLVNTFKFSLEYYFTNIYSINLKMR